MKSNLVVPIVIFALVGIISVLSHRFNLYDLWYTDIILHTISGIAFGYAWTGFQQKQAPGWIVFLGCVSFATFGSVLWEFGELGAWRFIPAYAPMYSPNFFDTLGDIACGMTGGIMMALVNGIRRK